MSDRQATITGQAGNDARDTRFCQLGNKDATTASRQGGAVGVRIRVLYSTALVIVRLEGAVRRIDECARLHRIDNGAAGLGVQRGLRVLHHVDALERVDFAACGPIWGLRPEGGPDGALTKDVSMGIRSRNGRRVHRNDDAKLY